MDPESIVVLRALRGLGDLLCATPALRALRRRFPAAHIALVALPETRSLLERYPHLVDEVIDFPGWPGVPERELDAKSPGRIVEFLAAMQDRRWDVVVNLQGSGRVTNSLCALLGAGTVVGPVLDGEYHPTPATSVVYDHTAPEPLRLLRILEPLGVESDGVESEATRLEFAVRDSDVERAVAAAGFDVRTTRYAVLHPGANHDAKLWPLDRFVTVGRALVERDLRVVLTGVGVEAEAAAYVRAGIGDQDAVVDLCGRSDVGATAAVVRHAAVVVCNDTGVSHLAAALATPSVVIFRWSDASRWAPLDRRRHRALGAPQPVAGACGRCLADGCRALHVSAGSAAFDDVAAGDVIAEIDDLLRLAV